MRFLQLWERVRASLWFVPTLLTVAAAVAAYGTLAIDRGAVEHHPKADRPPLPDGVPVTVRARKAGYVESVDEGTLFSIAKEGRAAIRMEPEIGGFVLPGEALASVWFDDGRPDDGDLMRIERKVRKAMILGSEWTLQQDLGRALVELSDIAVRALSPSLNDPTTATLCVDRLGEILTLVGNRRFPSAARTDEAGRVRFIARRLSWERAVGVSFERIRLHAARSPAVLIRVIEVCGRIALIVPPMRRAPLDGVIRDALAEAERELKSESDLRRVRQAADEALRAG